MKASFLKVNFLISAVLLLFSSCDRLPGRQPTAETVRLYALASQAYAEGNFTEAAEILVKEKKFPPAVLLRAKSEYFSGNFDAAENSCRRALKLRPSSFEAKLYLARILREKNSHEESARLVEELLADNPQDIRALRLAAEAAIEEEKFDEASAFLNRAAEFSAESAMVLLDRARLHWIAGRAAQALEDLNRAKAMLPWGTPLLRTITNLENTIRGYIK
jgi:tetratricopeptide (TPR) repeat protein